MHGSDNTKVRAQSGMSEISDLRIRQRSRVETRGELGYERRSNCQKLDRSISEIRLGRVRRAVRLVDRGHRAISLLRSCRLAGPAREATSCRHMNASAPHC